MAMLGNTSYEISRPTGVCAGTGRPIAVGEAFVAVLAEDEEQERLERLDFSADAWQAGARPRPPLRLYGYWRATMAPPDAKRKPFIDDAALMDMFSQLEGVGEPGRVSFRYLLAIMLLRKRLLKYEGTRRGEGGGRPVMLVRPATPAGATPGELMEVVDPAMDDAAIAEAVEQLTAVLADGGGR